MKNLNCKKKQKSNTRHAIIHMDLEVAGRIKSAYEPKGPKQGDSGLRLQLNINLTAKLKSLSERLRLLSLLPLALRFNN